MKGEMQYGFQAHLTAEFPSQIVFDVTEFCNMACIHCPQSEFTKSKHFKGSFLDPNLHKKMIDEVRQEGKGYCKYLRYTAQGETLLHPNIIQMMDYSTKNSGIPINITTNGMLLTENLSKLFIDSGVDVIDISIDANTAKTYSLIRKKGDFKITKANVLRLIGLIKSRGSNMKVVVSFIEQPINIHESADFKKFWTDAGANFVVIRRLHSAGGFKKELVKTDKNRYPCLYPWERLTLGADGCVYFCPQDWVGGSRICDFRSTTIKQIWRGDFMEQLRNAHLENKFSDFNLCAQCPDWSTTRWPKQDRAYSNMMQDFLLNNNKQNK